MSEPIGCPECGKPMLYMGVMLQGNFETGEKAHPVGRWDCNDCMIIVADEDIDPEWGWEQWEKQGNRRTG